MATLSDYYFSEEPMVICDRPVPSICADFDPNCPSVVDRFFTRFYYRRPGHRDEDHLVLFHSNRVFLIGLAPSHVALRKGVRSVNFNIRNLDRSQNQCSGKGKKGGMNLQAQSAVALLTCEDGSEYKVYGCFNSKLLEVNERLRERPAMLAEEGDGYVAVGLPKVERIEAIKEALLTEEQYRAAVAREAREEEEEAEKEKLEKQAKKDEDVVAEAAEE